MEKGHFDIFLKADVVEKSSDSGKSYFIQGVGSTISVDRQGERLSEKALARLEEIATTKRIPVFSQHDHSWESTMGYISKSEVSNGQWVVDIALEDPKYNGKSELLINKKRHGTPIGLSIGGRVLKDYIDKANDSMTRVIDDLELLELSIVGIPANQDGSVVSYIAKSLEVDTMTEKEIAVVETKAETPVEEPKAVETVEVAKEEVMVEVAAPVEKEVVFSVEIDQIKKDIAAIASQIAGLTAVRKAVAVETEKEQIKEESKDSLSKMLEERLK